MNKEVSIILFLMFSAYVYFMIHPLPETVENTTRSALVEEIKCGEINAECIESIKFEEYGIINKELKFNKKYTKKEVIDILEQPREIENKIYPMYIQIKNILDIVVTLILIYFFITILGKITKS